MNNQNKQLSREVEVEEKFLDMWNGCTIKFDYKKRPESIFLVKNDKYMFEQDYKNGYLWCSYDDVWSVFNVVQEKIMSGDFTYFANNKVRKARKIKNFKQDIVLNEKLYDLALAYAN
jgi:hypothetical protein